MQRVAGELHDRMRRITDPYLRERLADLEDLAGRLLTALDRRAPRPAVAAGRDPAGPPAGTGRTARLARRAASAGVAIEEASPAGHAAILARALGPAGGGRHARACWTRPSRATRRCWTPTRASSSCAPRPRCAAPTSARWRRRSALQAGWARAARPPAATARRRAGCSLMLNVGLSMELAQLDTHRRRRHRPVPHRDRHAGARRDRRRGRAGGDLRARAGCGGRAAGAVPHARPRRRQAAAGRRAGGGEPGDGLALAAHRPGPAGAAAPAVARAAAGGRRAAAVGDVPDGRDGGRVPRRAGAAAGRGAAGAARRRSGCRSAPCWRCRR